MCRVLAQCSRSSSTMLSWRVHTKQVSVSHCLEHIWEPVHEIHHSWLVPALCGVRMCVWRKKPSLGHLCFVQLTNECQVQRPPDFAPRPLRQNRSAIPSAVAVSKFTINFLHLVRQSAMLKSHFVKSSVTTRSTFTPTFCKHHDRFPSSPFHV